MFAQSPRENECRRAHDTPDRRGDGHRGNTAPGSGRKEEFGDLAPRRVTPADYHGLEGKARKHEA
ncbi:MAG TPA: hypothetical protein VNM70_08375, partial [Burkholderiales bacterium]|nr:hypothetical protein [Burkholderiales bacterium]